VIVIGEMFWPCLHIEDSRTIAFSLKACQEEKKQGGEYMMTEAPPVRDMKSLFQKIKSIHSLNSDRECWELLKLSKAFFQDVKAGRKHLSNEKALRIAPVALLSGEAMLVLIQREKANSEEERLLWNNIIQGQRRIMSNMRIGAR